MDNIPSCTNHLAAFLEYAPVAMSLVSGDTFIVEVANRKQLELWHRPAEEIIGLPLFSVFPELASTDFKKILSEVRNRAERYVGTDVPVLFFRNNQLEQAWFDFTYEPVPDGAGIVNSILVVSIEVTDRVKRARAKQAQEEELRTFINVIPHIAWVIDENDQVIFTNDRAKHLWQAENHSCFSPVLASVVHPDDQAATVRLWNELRILGEENAIDHRLQVSSLTYNWYTTKFVPVKSPDSESIRWYVTSTDIQKYKDSEAKLRASEESVKNTNQLLDLSLSAGKIGLWHWDIENNKLQWTPKQEELYGLAPGEFKGTYEDFHKFVLEEDLRWIMANVSPSSPDNPFQEYEFRVKRKDGQIRWIKGKSQTLFDAQHRAVFITGTNTDITEQRVLTDQLTKSVNDLKQAEEFNRSILESSPDCFKVLDSEGHLLFMNQNGLRQMEIDDFSAIQHKYWWDLWNEDNRDLVRRAFHKAVAGEQIKFQASCPTAKGKLKWWDVVISPESTGGEKAKRVISVSRDVTEKIEYEMERTRLASVLNSFLSAAPLGLGYVDREFRYLLVNDHLAAYHGIPVAEHVGKTIGEVTPENWRTLQPIYQHVLTSGKQVTDFEFFSGNRRTYSANIFPLLDGAGVVGVGCNILDISERKAIYEKLMASEAQFRSIFENAAVGIAHKTMDGRWLKVNKKLCEILGYTDSELCRIDVSALTHQDDIVDDRRLFSEAIEGETDQYTREKRLIHKSGAIVWVNVTVSLVREFDHRPSYFIELVEDISQRKVVEERLAMAQAAGNAGFFEWDFASGKVYVTGYLRQICSADPDTGELRLSEWSGSVPADDHRRIMQLVSEACQEQIERVSYEFRMLVGHGTALKAVGINYNITERKNIEEAFTQSLTLLNAISNNSKDIIFAKDVQGRLLFVNPIIAHYFEKKPNELIGQDEYYYIKDQDAARTIRENDIRIMTNNMAETIEEVITFSHESKVFLSVKAPMIDQSGNVIGLVGVAHDITDRKRAEATLLESEARFRTLAESLPQMVWICNSLGELEYTSSQWEKYSGESDPQKAWQQMVHPSEREEVLRAWKECLATHGNLSINIRLRHKSGSYRWHHSFAHVIKDGAGNTVKWVGALTDIDEQVSFSEKLKTEIELNTRELKRSNQELQQFAHVASHDLKEPVRKIALFSNMLMHRQDMGINGSGQSLLNKIHRSSLRMLDMIDGILKLSRAENGVITKDPVDLNEVFGKIQQELELFIEERRAKIVVKELCTVYGSPILLYQLFYNLLQNAVKFSRDDGDVMVFVESRKVFVSMNPEVEEGEYVQVEVKDNGIGFDESHAEIIFNSFVRLNTKDRFEGSGLGLSLCKRIAERHKGFIQAKSAAGQGAKFLVHLPV